MTDQTTEQSVSFFGKMLTFSRIKLLTDNFDTIKSQLAIVSPEKNSLIPIVIDSDVDIDLKKLTDLLWEWGLQPIGVTKGKLDEQAKKLRLAIFPADGKRLQRVKPQARTKQTVSSVQTKEEPQQAKQKNKATVRLDKEQTSTTNKEDKTAVEKEITKTHSADTSKTITTESKNTDTQVEAKKDKESKTNQTNIENDTANNLEANANIEKNLEVNKNSEVTIENEEKSSDKTANTESVDNTQDKAETPEPVQVIHVVEQITSLVYDQMLRSGQSINHVGGDLILTNSVNDGAEAITDNSLHIYGKGMGRLVAGATGDEDAHIFCQRFNPSLVSVAGTYMLRDSIPAEFIDKSVQVSYKEGEGLVFRVMDNWSQTINQNTISR